MNITTPPDNRKARANQRQRDLQEGLLTWDHWSLFVTAICHNAVDKRLHCAHKTKNAWNHIVYITGRARTVNTHCAHTLDLTNANKWNRSQKTSHQLRQITLLPEDTDGFLSVTCPRGLLRVVITCCSCTHQHVSPNRSILYIHIYSTQSLRRASWIFNNGMMDFIWKWHSK